MLSHYMHTHKNAEREETRRWGESLREMEERKNITRSKHSFILENPIF